MNMRPVLLTIALVLIISALTVFPFTNFGVYEWQIVLDEEPEGNDETGPLLSPGGDSPRGPSVPGNSGNGHGGSGAGDNSGESDNSGSDNGGSDNGESDNSGSDNGGSDNGGSDNGNEPDPVAPAVTPETSENVVPVPEFPLLAVPAAFLAGILGMVLLVRGRNLQTE